MRELAVAVFCLPLMVAVVFTIWLMVPERQIARSAVLAGIVVGWVAAGAAW